MQAGGGFDKGPNREAEQANVDGEAKQTNADRKAQQTDGDFEWEAANVDGKAEQANVNGETQQTSGNFSAQPRKMMKKRKIPLMIVTQPKRQNLWYRQATPNS